MGAMSRSCWSQGKTRFESRALRDGYPLGWLTPQEIAKGTEALVWKLIIQHPTVGTHNLVFYTRPFQFAQRASGALTHLQTGKLGKLSLEKH